MNLLFTFCFKFNDIINKIFFIFSINYDKLKEFIKRKTLYLKKKKKFTSIFFYYYI